MNAPAQPHVMPMLPKSVIGLVSPEFNCVRIDIAAPDNSYQILAGFILEDGARLGREPELAVCPELVFSFNNAAGGHCVVSYNPSKWVIVHRATGITVSPAFTHFNLAASLARDLETVANWERMKRGARACAPEIAIPSFQLARVATLVKAAVQAAEIVRS